VGLTETNTLGVLFPLLHHCAEENIADMIWKTIGKGLTWEIVAPRDLMNQLQQQQILLSPT
jgi:glucuronate isomerase